MLARVLSTKGSPHNVTDLRMCPQWGGSFDYKALQSNVGNFSTQPC